MPHPRGRDNLSPGELAKQLARQLAVSAPAKTGFSLRKSVLIGRLISGAIVLLTVGALVTAVFAGVNWLLDGDSGRAPQVLAESLDGGVPAGIGSTTAPTGDPLLLGDGSTTTSTLWDVTTSTAPATSFLPGLPPVTTPLPSTTTTRPGSTPSSAPTVTTTLPTVTTTTLPTTTSSPLPTITLPPPTTTTTLPATTTTQPLPTTTTTVPPTTTTTFPPTTTTTCHGNGNGNGNCK